MKEKGILSVYLWALSYIKPYKSLLFWLVVTGFIISGIQLLIPKGMQFFVDDIEPQQLRSVFWFLIAGLTIAVLIMFGLMAIRNLIRRSLQERAASDVQFDILQHLRKLGLPYFENRPIGESLSLMNTEVHNLQELYRFYFPRFIESFLFVCISLVFMASMNLMLTLTLIPCFFLYYIVGPYFSRKAAATSKAFTDNRILYNKKVYESVASLSELKSNHAENWDFKRFTERFKPYLDSRIVTVFYAYMRGGVRMLTTYIGAIAVIILGIHFVEIERISVGMLVAFLLYYFQAMYRLTALVSLTTEQKVLMLQSRKIYEFMQLTPDVKEPSSPLALSKVRGKIEFQQVCFAYGDIPVLDSFSLSVRPGERIALVGTSGSGKSTLLKLMVRFYDPKQGEIKLDDIAIDQLSFAQLRDSIGYVFQETYLFGASVRDNILFGHPDASEKEVVAAAKSSNAHQFIMELSDGYDTLLGERGVKLSGGQKQRISIARLFIKNPSIILLDEATSALDRSSEQEVQAALDRLLVGKTTITVAHRLSTIENYDRIAVMEQGRIIEIGTHEQLLKRNGKYYELLLGDKQREEVSS